MHAKWNLPRAPCILLIWIIRILFWYIKYVQCDSLYEWIGWCIQHLSALRNGYSYMINDLVSHTPGPSKKPLKTLIEQFTWWPTGSLWQLTNSNCKGWQRWPKITAYIDWRMIYSNLSELILEFVRVFERTSVSAAFQCTSDWIQNDLCSWIKAGLYLFAADKLILFYILCYALDIDAIKSWNGKLTKWTTSAESYVGIRRPTWVTILVILS